MRAIFKRTHPFLADPMDVIEEYVTARKLRLVDLFMQVRLNLSQESHNSMQMDRNRDGTITAEEISHSVNLLKIRLDDVQMAELINRMDLDGDGE